MAEGFGGPLDGLGDVFFLGGDGGDGLGIGLVHEGDGVEEREFVEMGAGGVGLLGLEVGAVGDGHGGLTIGVRRKGIGVRTTR